MKTLEHMANETFNRYAGMYNIRADWAYLSSKRKLSWMKDILNYSNYFLINLKAEIKPIPANKLSNTVYESGFNDGVRSERTSFIVLVENLYDKLLDEYEQFEYSVKEESQD